MKRTILTGLGLLVLTASVVEAADVQHAVCLKARNGKFVAPSASEARIFPNADACEGAAVLIFEDKTGGALKGADKVYIGTAGLATRWGTDGGSGTIGPNWTDYRGGTENFTVHRKAGNGVPIASGEAVYLNAYTGKWVYDGGNGPLSATAGAAEAGETFTLFYASKAAADAAKRAQQAALGGGSGDGYHRVCLLTRNGHYVSFTSGAPTVDKKAKNCTGNAVLHWRDQNGGALNGQDVFFFYNARRNDTWLANMNVHLKDRSTRAVKSGDEIHINATGGTWVYDNGGSGPLVNQSRTLGAGETFTLVYAPAVDTADVAKADQTAKGTAGKPAPKARPLDSAKAAGSVLNYGDTVVIRHAKGYLSADRWGRVSISQKADTAYRILDANGKAKGRPVTKEAKQVTLRVAKSHRWLQSSKDEDSGLIYRYAKLGEIYNFNEADAGSNKGVNDVVIFRPNVPPGWVFLGDAVFRYQTPDVYDNILENVTSLIFKDHPTAFRKPSGYHESWADGNSANGRLKNGRGAMARANKVSGYEWVGGTFFTEWCCYNLERARLIHRKYGAWLPLPQFWDTGATQWTARWQRYSREATAMVYDGGALIDLPDKGKFPLLWSHKWGFPMGCRGCWKDGGGRPHLVGNPGFLNGRFLKDFSYYADRHYMRSRPGAGEAGDAPGDAQRARFRLINPELANWADRSAVTDGEKVKIAHVHSGNCQGDACSLHADGSRVRSNARYRDADAWTIIRIDPKKVASRAIVFKQTTGSPDEGGAGGSLLVGDAREYGHGYEKPVLRRNGDLISLQEQTHGGSIGQSIAVLPDENRPSGTLVFPANHNQLTARLDVHPDGRIIWSTGGRNREWLSFANIHFTARGGRALSLAGGWRNYGGGFAPARVDKVGDSVVVLTGMITGGRGNHVATLPAGHRPPERLIFSVSHHGKPARVDVLPNGQVLWAAGAREHGWISLSGIVFSVRPQRSISLVGTWRPYGKGYRLPEMTKVGNTVILSGMLTGTRSRPAHLTTLPSGYRPRKILIFNGNAHDGNARIDIRPDGVVRVESGGTEHGWVSLSGIAFSTR